jgi:Response regulator containing CheY-like receiver and SARP domains
VFRVIGVDDEKKALDRFERIMKEDTRVSVTGTFTRVSDAIEFVRCNPVDIAFLDIEMPGLSGLELAERLAEEKPYIEIVFITAYDKYALKAFQAHAIGYLLKPLDIDEVREQIDNLSRKLGYRRETIKSGYLTVKCFGRFLCCVDENAVEPIRWRTAKAEELFALLIHYQGRAISKEILIDALWPEAEPEKAANHFRVTCTYLRNTLTDKGFANLLLRDRDSYLLDTSRLRCDLLLFLALAGATSELPALEEASDLYAGEYLGNKAFEWAANTRIWLENEYKKIQHRIADGYLISGENKKACAALGKALEHDPYDEEVVGKLISHKLQLGDSVSAVRIYQEYEQKLFEEMELSPSDKLKELMAAIMQ